MDFHKISRIRHSMFFLVFNSEYSHSSIFSDIRPINFIVFVHKIYFTNKVPRVYHFTMEAYFVHPARLELAISPLLGRGVFYQLNYGYKIYLIRIDRRK